jgi:hypothetical protein
VPEMSLTRDVTVATAWRVALAEAGERMVAEL